ncbi:MAG: transposase [Planktothrix sp.]
MVLKIIEDLGLKLRPLAIIDVGILNMLLTSDGLVIPRPKFLDQALRKIQLLQRKLKKKVLGSNNWKKLQHRIALLHEAVANRHKNYHFKKESIIVKNVDLKLIEILLLLW